MKRAAFSGSFQMSDERDGASAKKEQSASFLVMKT
jgi:hypothetical protein